MLEDKGMPYVIDAIPVPVPGIWKHVWSADIQWVGIILYIEGSGFSTCQPATGCF